MPQYGGRERGNMKRVVITGLGTVNPLGSTVEKFWENIKKGTLGVSKIDSFDTTELGVSVAGIIRDFDPAEYFERKDIRHMERFTQFAVVAAAKIVRQTAALAARSPACFFLLMILASLDIQVLPHRKHTAARTEKGTGYQVSQCHLPGNRAERNNTPHPNH